MVGSWLRLCATSRKVADLIPDGIIELGSTQPLTEMNTKNVSWGYRWLVRSADNLATSICQLSRNSGSLKLLGLLRDCPGRIGGTFPRKLRIYDLQFKNIKLVTYENQLGKAGYKKSIFNKCPTRCNTKQSVYYPARSLYMFRVLSTPIIRST